jgi:hypothetical protein
MGRPSCERGSRCLARAPFFLRPKTNGQSSGGLMLVFLVELDGNETDEQSVNPGAFPPTRT